MRDYIILWSNFYVYDFMSIYYVRENALQSHHCQKKREDFQLVRSKGIKK